MLLNPGSTTAQSPLLTWFFHPAHNALQENLFEFMSMLLKKAQRHADAGPFLQAVSAEDVPDYYSIIIVSASQAGGKGWYGFVDRLGGCNAEDVPDYYSIIIVSWSGVGVAKVQGVGAAGLAIIASVGGLAHVLLGVACTAHSRSGMPAGMDLPTPPCIVVWLSCGCFCRTPWTWAAWSSSYRSPTSLHRVLQCSNHNAFA